MRKPSTPGFLGHKLREAREARGLNGTLLSDLVGVSRQSISKYENGDQTPSPDVLNALSQALQIPVDYFISPRKRTVDKKSPIFYRSMSAAKSRDRERAEQRYVWLQDIVAYLYRFIEFPTVNIPVFDVPSDPSKITNELIEDLALKLRRYWKLGLGPISNITWLLENNGIIVSSYSLESDSLDAFSQFQYDRPYLILGTDKHSAARSRFNAAHELGHLILHKNLSVKDIKTAKTLKLIESQAHYFAGAFHLPEKSFADDFLMMNLDYFKLRKPKWKISIAAMLERAKNLGLVDGDKYQLLRRYYVRNKWGKFEPFDDSLDVEEPKLLKESLQMILENKVVTRADLLSRIRLNPNDVEDLCGLSRGYLSDAEVIQLHLKPSSKIRRERDGDGKVIDLFS
jgi:Zn-dependent peptidase ImmA (M78 family)/transcriptional regulator with XRE-family HTH domain